MKTETNLLPYSGMIAFFECGVGALFHSFRIPLTGQWLSLLQIFILSLASQRPAGVIDGFAYKISWMAMLIKGAISPGKKLTPMIAIAIQGSLFNLPFYFFGNNLFSLILGSIAASLSGVIQPILAFMFVFGTEGFLAWSKALAWVSLDPYAFLGMLIFIKLALSITISTAIFFMRTDFLSDLEKRLKRIDLPDKVQSAQEKRTLFQRVFRRLTKGPYILTLIAVMISMATESGSQSVLFFCRVILGILLLEVLPFEKWLFRRNFIIDRNKSSVTRDGIDPEKNLLFDFPK